MTIDTEEYRQQFLLFMEELQRKMLEYDRALQEKQSTQNAPRIAKRTIAEQEDIIINKFGGKKLGLDYFYEHLEYFCESSATLNELRLTEPYEIIFLMTEIIIPEEYFYSFYLIPIDESLKDHDLLEHYKELIIFVASRDGVNVYATTSLTSPIDSRHPFCDILRKELYYCEEGVAFYEDELEEQPVFPPELANRKTIKITSPFSTTYDFSPESIRQADELQRKILAYDHALQKKRKAQNTPPKYKRTIAEQEDIIFNQFGGKKLELVYFYEHLEDFFGNLTDFEPLRNLSPCKMIFTCKKYAIPDEYFYSFYLVPFEKNQQECDNPRKELILFFVTSRDALHVYKSDILAYIVPQPRDIPDSIHTLLRFEEDGVALYENEIEPILE